MSRLRELELERVSWWWCMSVMVGEMSDPDLSAVEDMSMLGISLRRC